MGQGGCSGCLRPGADCTEEALHNRSCLSLGLPDWPGRDGGREACSPWGRWLSWRHVHSSVSWANLKVFQSE